MLWSVIICGWTWCPSAETPFTIRGETIEAVPPTGWWSGRTEPLYWTGRRFRPRKNPKKQHHRPRTQASDCQVPPVTVARRDARRQGLGGAAVRGVPFPAGQTPATPHPWSPAPRRAEMMKPRSSTRMEDRRRHLWKTGWWNGRRRTRSCRSLWSHSTPERVRLWIIVKMQTVYNAYSVYMENKCPPNRQNLICLHEASHIWRPKGGAHVCLKSAENLVTSAGFFYFFET